MYLHRKKKEKNAVHEIDAFEEGDFIHQSRPRGSAQLRKFSNLSTIMPNAIPLPEHTVSTLRNNIRPPVYFPPKKLSF